MQNLAETIIVLVWIILNLFSLASPHRKNLSRHPPLTHFRIVIVVLVEISALTLSAMSPRLGNKYFEAIGAILLVIGWTVSNHRMLAPRMDQRRLIYLRGFWFSLIGIHRDFYNLSLSGDWIQLTGFALVLNSPYGILFS